MDVVSTTFTFLADTNTVFEKLIKLCIHHNVGIFSLVQNSKHNAILFHMKGNILDLRPL